MPHAQLNSALLVALLLGLARGAVDLDFGSTDVELAEKPRAVVSVSPNVGTSNGGTRLHIDGYGWVRDNSRHGRRCRARPE